MHQFNSEHFTIQYDDLGEGTPVILLHGFAADRRSNWKATGWYRDLVDEGFRVVAADARGHGRSQRSSDPEDYRPEKIAGDTIRLMDHLGLEKAHLIGYSMGGRNAAWLLSQHPDRFYSVVIGGTGINLLAPEEAQMWEGKGYQTTPDNIERPSLAKPRLAPLLNRLTGFQGRLPALAACLLGGFPSMSSEAFTGNSIPTLVACGQKDTISGSPEPLAASIPNAHAVEAPGKSHLTAITDPYYRGAVLGFLNRERMQQAA